MHRQLAAALVVLLCSGLPSSRGAEPALDYPIRPVAAHHVHVNDAFWLPRLETNRTVTIPYSFRMCEETGRVENFKVAGKLSSAKWAGMFGFSDSDVYKVIEGASYSLMARPDDKLAAYLGQLVDWIAAAQEPDGYLYTASTARDLIAPNQLRCCYPRNNTRWLSEIDSHELYNAGHMIEAAVAHWEATGDDKFLNVAKKSADLIVESFGPGKIELPPGHPEIELALVKLYRATNDERYLKLAQFFVEVRGRVTADRPELWGENRLDHKPLVDQQEAVGHAVRAVYLYAGATDVAALTGDRAISAAMDRLWENTAGKKTYITGGIGAIRQGEAFGKNYELPNETAYAETCASVGSCLWNHRMFLWHGEGKYMDLLERALYNGTISSVSLDGKTFFYPNPLASSGGYERSKWFDCSCCPTSICRFIPSVPGYVYATRDNVLYVNLFMTSSAELKLADGSVEIAQETDYPWNGRVTIRVQPHAASQKAALKVRIPGWARGEAFVSDLYHFADTTNDVYKLAVNGGAVTSEIANGYATIDRVWKPGDIVTLELPMPVRRVVANDEVEADRGRVALMRGPLVYCVEWPDVERGKVSDLTLADGAPLTSDFKKVLLGGVQVVSGTAQRIDLQDKPGKQSEGKSVDFTAIPYYAWAHRGKGEMEVWLARVPGK
jgi:uncharacterized protein